MGPAPGALSAVTAPELGLERNGELRLSKMNRRILSVSDDGNLMGMKPETCAAIGIFQFFKISAPVVAIAAPLGDARAIFRSARNFGICAPADSLVAGATHSMPVGCADVRPDWRALPTPPRGSCLTSTTTISLADGVCKTVPSEPPPTQSPRQHLNIWWSAYRSVWRLASNLCQAYVGFGALTSAAYLKFRRALGSTTILP
ncbi:hypothetical protein C8R46DRAFT_1038912 [Mycena filopes]|nr:hypothetical protein C8R46DRAFT_1038912 [Mycena filopes]